MQIEELEQIIEEEPGVLLYFSGEQCGLCAALMPKVKELFCDKFDQIKQVYLDADSNRTIASHFTVLSVPTLIVFLDGKETLRESRSISLAKLSDKLWRPYSMIVQ